MCIRDRISQRLLQPVVQAGPQRRSAGLSCQLTLKRRLAPNLGLNPIQDANSPECLRRNRRSVRLVQIEELTPHMRPARRLLDRPVGIQRIEAAIGISLQDALE